MGATKYPGRKTFYFLVAGCIGLSPLPGLAQDAPSQFVEAAKTVIEQARKAGAEKEAADDLAAARSWLAQAEQANSVFNNLLTMVMTAAMKKAREDEIVYFATMARIKGLTAEAKAKRAATTADLKSAQKTLSDYQNALAVANARREASGQAKAEADLKELEQSRRRVTELEAAREQDARRGAEREKELDAAKSEQQKLALMQARMRAMEEEKAMLAAAGRIPDAAVRSGDRKIVVSILAINLFTPGNDLLPAGRQILDSVGIFLKTYPNNKVVVRGHTDSRGAAQANQVLSERRAQRVREYLVTNQNLSPGRITAEGLAASEPVATNATDAGRALNRRVEVNVLMGD